MKLLTLPLRLVQSSPRFNKPSIYRTLASMATAHTIQITPDNTGLWQISQDESAAKKATELLQEDLEVHRVLYQ